MHFLAILGNYTITASNMLGTVSSKLTFKLFGLYLNYNKEGYQLLFIVFNP